MLECEVRVRRRGGEERRLPLLVSPNSFVSFIRCPDPKFTSGDRDSGSRQRRSFVVVSVTGAGVGVGSSENDSGVFLRVTRGHDSYASLQTP